MPAEEGIWQGTLYEGKAQPFDKISWYARVNDKELTYFLNAKRDNNLWWLEIAGEVDLYQPLPNIRETIDAEFLKSRGFVEGKSSFWRLPPMPVEKAAKLVGFRLDELRYTFPDRHSAGYVPTFYHQQFSVFSSAKDRRGRRVDAPLDNPKTEATVSFRLDQATTSDLIIRSLSRRNWISAGQRPDPDRPARKNPPNSRKRDTRR